MDGKTLRDRLAALVEEYDSTQTPVSLPSGSNLTLALEKGGLVQLESNGTYEGTATFRKSNTVLRGAPGARVIGSGGPALYVPPGINTIEAHGFEATAPSYTEAVVRLGDNGPTQTRVDQQPYALVLGAIQVPTHRGKRAFEINARAVSLVSCGCSDTWHSSFDSAGIAVLNSSGGISVLGGEYQAGSNGFLAGGDTVKILGADGKPVTPAWCTVDGVRFTRPLSWRVDGINRRVKNLYELKNAKDFSLKNSYLSGNWKAAQTGEPMLFTPTRGGVVIRATVEDCIVENVPSCVEVVGRHFDIYTPEATSVAIRRTRFLIDKSLSGSGSFAKVGASPAAFIVDDSRVQSVGSPSETLVEYYRGDIRNEDGTMSKGGAIDTFWLRRNQFVTGKYALRLDGQQGGGPNGEGLAVLIGYDVTDNDFGGDTINSYQKKNFPSNRYLTRAAFDAAFPWQPAA